MCSSSSMELPSHRACATCRNQKVRCLPEEGNPDICQKCAKSGRPCIFTPLQKRKQRKRTDTRVAELEREMRVMRSMLNAKQDGTRSPPPEATNDRRAGSMSAQRSDPSTSRPEQCNAAADGGQPDLYRTFGVHRPIGGQPYQQGMRPLGPSRSANGLGKDGGDVIDRGLISMSTAKSLLDIYRRDLFSHYPMVPISPSTTAEELRTTKPTLFLAIIAAASGKNDSDLSATLDKEVLQAYATRSLVRSEKSLELVQALLISAVWYHPPSKFGQLKYYEYIHMAATMAMDIGIGTRPLQHRSRQVNAVRGREPAQQAMIHPAEDASNPDLSMAPRSRGASPNTGSTESRRTFLACYAICAGVSLSLRRPNMLRVSSYVRECVEHLEHAHDALASDRTIVLWVKLLMIAEEIMVSFSYDDPGGIASITELRTQLMLKDYEKRLTAWFNSTPEKDINPSGIIMYYTIRLYLHEIALHVDHSSEDFRAPYQMGTIHPSDCENIPTQILAESIAECINCSHGLLNTFLAMSPDSLRASPVFNYVRVSFAAFVLAKLCLSAAHPASRIGSVIDYSSLKVESYLDRAVLHVRNVVGVHKTRVPAIFLALLFKLRQWCLHPDMLEQSQAVPEAGSSGVSRAQDGLSNPAMEIQGPRIVEQRSSNESSPQDFAGGHSATAGVKGIVIDLDTPKSTVSATEYPIKNINEMQPSIMSNEDVNTSQTETFRSDPPGSINVPQMDGLTQDELQQMQSDFDFFNSLGEGGGGFPEGGFTGLDDWTTDSLAGMDSGQDMFNWQDTSRPAAGGFT